MKLKKKAPVPVTWPDWMVWPADTRENQKIHAATHVQLLEFALKRCRQFRTAVQAGGNVGFWPMRMAQLFTRVLTFEPEPITHAVLAQNMSRFPNVSAFNAALGAEDGHCGIERLSLGSHKVITGDAVDVMMIDGFCLENVDLIQLDIEGYELHALKGAVETIKRCKPILQLEIRGLGGDDAELFKWLAAHGYRQVERHLHDLYFEPVGGPA